MNIKIKNIKQHLIKTFHAYIHSSTFHCIKYIGMLNLNFIERVFWLTAIALFFALCCTVSFFIWEKYNQTPTVVKIEDTHLPFTSVAFPAVTICPANRIKPSLAYAYIIRYLNKTTTNKELIMKHLVSALSLLQYPTYIHMEYHLKKVISYLPLFDSLNITDLMVKSLPACDEIMKHCYWQGKKENCCKIFSLQRTEEGFCYSFNSMLSEANKFCPVYVPPIMLYKDENTKHHRDRRCRPRHTTSSGVFSGLTVTMKEDIIKDRIGPNGSKYERGVVVLITTSHELPEAGTGTTLETLYGEMLQIEVRPIVIRSSRKLIHMAQEDRRCSLHNERRLWIYNLYTQSTCLAECRLKFIEMKCKCQLYFFYDSNSLQPPCTMEQLKCIAKLKIALAVKNLLSKDPTSCQCVLPCYGIIYEKSIKKSNLTILNGNLEYGILDIHFTSKGGIKYSTKKSFPEIQLIVSIGSACNLFLGCSIISIFEIIYYFFRACFLCKKNTHRRMVFQRKAK